MSLEAEQAIKNLIYDYSIYLDKGDFDSLCGLFAHGTLEIQVTKSQILTLRGTDEMRKWVDENVVLYNGTPKTSHLNTNVRVKVAVDGLTATANTHLTVMQKVAKALQPIIIGYYDDEFKKIDGVWWMTRRAETVISAGNMSGHGTHVPA